APRPLVLFPMSTATPAPGVSRAGTTLANALDETGASHRHLLPSIEESSNESSCHTVDTAVLPCPAPGAPRATGGAARQPRGHHHRGQTAGTFNKGGMRVWLDPL